MEKALIDLMLSSAVLSSLVGKNMHWGRAPQKTKPPYIVLQVISGPRNYTFQRRSKYVANRLQFDVYTATYLEGTKIVAALDHLLSGHRGGMFQAFFIDNERDFPAADAGEVNQLFRKSLDVLAHLSK